MARVAVVGLGVVGSAVASILNNCGYQIAALNSRNPDKALNLARRLNCPHQVITEEAIAEADIVFITTSDSAIAKTAKDLADKGLINSGQTVIHMSGALPSSVLSPAQKAGASIISIHPLQSFANIETAINNLAGSFFTVEGDGKALTLAQKLIDDFGGQSFYIKEEDKAIYHAAACVASNYLVSLVDYAISLLQIIGIPGEKALEALQPLIRGTLNNITDLGTAKALTGPIARGDRETISKHLTEIQGRGPEYTELYRQLGLYTVKVALEKGSVGSETAKSLTQTLRGNY